MGDRTGAELPFLKFSHDEFRVFERIFHPFSPACNKIIVGSKAQPRPANLGGVVRHLLKNGSE